MEYAATGNELLDQIVRSDERAAAFILGDAQHVDFTAGQRLQRAGEPIDSCYFPTEGVLALIGIIDGDVEVTTLGVGFDGGVHASVGVELDQASHDVVARLPGRLWQVSAAKWRILLDENPAVRHVVAGFTDFLLRLMQHELACERRHDVESRFCRWLLELHRWQRAKPLAITHQGLSQLLGVRRTTITLLTRSLDEAGIVRAGRGVIEVIDPYALRQASCQCHDIRRSWASRSATSCQENAGEIPSAA